MPPPPETRAHPIGDALGLSFQSALRVLPAELAASFTEAARAVVAVAPQRIARAFMIGAAAPGATREHLIDGARIIASPSFAELARPLQDLALSTWQRLTASAELRAVLSRSLEGRLFERLSEQEAAQWLRCIAGPKSGPYSAAGHAELLGAYWSSRAPDLRWLLTATCARAASTPARVTRFFHEPTRPLHIVRQGSRSPTLILFGDPADPRSLCYAHDVARSAAQTSRAPKRSLAPRVCCNWNERSPRVRALSLHRSTLLTRLEELELLDWIENNHVLSESGLHWPSEVPFGVFVGSVQLVARVEAMAYRLAAPRGGLRFQASVTQGPAPNPPQRVSVPRTGAGGMG